MVPSDERIGMSGVNRLGRLRERLRKEGLDAILISSPENRRYLSGFTGSAGYLLVSQDDASLATDFRYMEQAAMQAPDFQIERIGGRPGWFLKIYQYKVRVALPVTNSELVQFFIGCL